jgi:hypothetical protein
MEPLRSRIIFFKHGTRMQGIYTLSLVTSLAMLVSLVVL